MAKNRLKKLSEKNVNRAAFLASNAVATSGLARTGRGNSLMSNGPEKVLATGGADQGKWVTAGCNYDCGGRCLNKVLVVDNVVVRQKTDDTRSDSPVSPQQRACPRGRSQRNQVFGADKLKYPMKRKHYTTGGGKKELRGVDEWERISWDEALEIVATELKNAKTKYGNESILVPSFYLDPARAMTSVLNIFGGYIGTWSPASFGSWLLAGLFGVDWAVAPTNDRLDFLNTETVILFSANPAWTSPGNGFYYYQQLKKAGVRFITVDPFYSDSAAALDAEWMPVRIGSDTALLLAVAHVLISEDDPVDNPLIDWDFLRRCTQGFDETMMPEGADPKDNFRDYVLGTYDGQPKDPKWAHEICGLEPVRIRQLAYEMRKDRKVSLLCGFASARTTDGDALPQAFMTIGAMTGHFGKSGHNCGPACHRTNINAGPFLYSVGLEDLPFYGVDLFGGAKGLPLPITTTINHNELWDAVLDGKALACNGDGTPGTVRDFDIHVMVNLVNASLDTVINANKGIKATRKVDFVVSFSQYPNGTAIYSDVILPITTAWENVGVVSNIGTRDAIIFASNVIKPLYEAKSYRWIAVELAKKLGIDASEFFPFDEKQAFFNVIKGTTVVESDGKTRVPVATITQEDIDEWGVQGQPQQGKVALKELLDRGIYQIERHKGDNYSYIAYEQFRKDPEANPLPSASGKLEIYSPTHAHVVTALGYGTRDPLPKYMPGAEGYVKSFTNWDSKVRGEYPYQLYSIHYLGRAHTNFTSNTWMQEAFTAPIYMSSVDAAKNGIKDGDTVLVSSRYGKILRRASVTERFMSGVMTIPHGSWVGLNEKTGIDEGGAENIICGTPSSVHGTNAYNSMLVKVEKWTGKPMVPDCEKPRRVLG